MLARARGDRRLRLRDEIADAVGLPVLASVSSYRAKDVSDWAYLLEHYSPTAVDAWSLRKTLHHLGLDVKGGPPASLTVISFAEDDKALPLGPQLAAFANSIGITTSIVVDTHQERPPGSVALDIHLVVVDRDAPHLAGAEPHHQHDRRPVGRHRDGRGAGPAGRGRGRADDRTIDGLVVTDPDPSDRTIGRVSQSQRRAGSRLPTLLTGSARRTTMSNQPYTEPAGRLDPAWFDDDDGLFADETIDRVPAGRPGHLPVPPRRRPPAPADLAGARARRPGRAGSRPPSPCRRPASSSARLLLTHRDGEDPAKAMATDVSLATTHTVARAGDRHC